MSFCDTGEAGEQERQGSRGAGAGLLPTWHIRVHTGTYGYGYHPRPCVTLPAGARNPIQWHYANDWHNANPGAGERERQEMQGSRRGRGGRRGRGAGPCTGMSIGTVCPSSRSSARASRFGLFPTAGGAPSFLKSTRSSREEQPCSRAPSRGGQGRGTGGPEGAAEEGEEGGAGGAGRPRPSTASQKLREDRVDRYRYRA